MSDAPTGFRRRTSRVRGVAGANGVDYLEPLPPRPDDERPIEGPIGRIWRPPRRK